MSPAEIIGRTVLVTVDRPLGSVHPSHPDMIYPINYGYVPGILGGDGEEQDVYLLGVEQPVSSCRAVILAVLHRKNDNEDKWVAAPEGSSFSKEEIWKQVQFQEQYFDSELILPNEDDSFFPCWFQGLSNGLSLLPRNEQERLLACCGQACSYSGSLQKYQEAKRSSSGEADFLNRLQSAFPEIEVQICKPGTAYDLFYRYCACGLVKKNYLSIPAICECSRQSLLLNWEAIAENRSVQVELLKSILNGAERCHFRVTLK